MYINKWLFKDFDLKISNFNFQKTIPFCSFSDLDEPNYDLIASSLDILGYDKDMMVFIGQNAPSFGIHINPTDPLQYEQLLNSVQMSFIFDKLHDHKKYIIQSVLAGVMPICNINDTYTKFFGLSKKYGVVLTPQNIAAKVREILDKGRIYQYDIYWKSWNYHQQIKKWQDK